MSDLLMEDVFPSYDVFINHRGPDVKKSLASLIYRDLTEHGLRVFLDEQELQVGDSFPPAIESAIRGASVQIAIFSKTYAKSVWCLDELLWMFKSQSGKIIPIFYDIQPCELRNVDRGAYAEAFEEHRNNGREQVESWIKALREVAKISGVVFETAKDNHGDRLKQIVEEVLEKVGGKQLYVCDHPVGLFQAAADLEKEVLSASGTHVVGIVGLGGSGKSTLVTHLYNSKCSQFQRSCFLSEVSKGKIPTLQQILYRDLLRDHNLRIEDKRRGKTLLKDRLQGLPVLIVFEDIDNKEQIDNLLFVKNVVGTGSLILVTSRDQTLLHSCGVKIYNVKLLGAKDAQELFCWHAFGLTEPVHGLQDMVEELVKRCGGFPSALIVLAGQLYNERDPEMWKKHVESLRKVLPNEVFSQILKHSYDSLDDIGKEAFLDVAHFLMGEDKDLVERVLDGLTDDGFQCLQTLRRKCLVEFHSADRICRRALRGADVNWSTSTWRRAKGNFRIRMHDLVRDLARQIGRQKLPLRLCCSSNKMIPAQDFSDHGSVQGYVVRGIRRDEDHELPVFLQKQDIYGLKLLADDNCTILRKFRSVSGDLTWFRLRKFEDTSNPPLSWNNLTIIPSTLSLTSLRVLEVHGVSPQDFCNLFDDREPPSQLRALEVQLHALEVTRATDFASASTSTAGPSKAVSAQYGSASETSDSLQSVKNLGQWFQVWLGKLNLKNLCKMVLQNILGLKGLPIKFEEVKLLTHVDLSGCSDLEVLPDSFTEELVHLQYLALRDCRKLVLQHLGKISKLKYLDFEGCSMLRKMPKGTEVQKFLKYLNVVRTGLRELPEPLEQLKDLEELYIGSSELRYIPSYIYNFPRLTDLNLLGCAKLPFIDDSIEKLEPLECFRIYKCGIRDLPKREVWMKTRILDVQNCPLISGSVLQRGLYECRNQSSCLTNLIIRKTCIYEIDIPQAEKLFPKLESVDLSDNYFLRRIGFLPDSLISLYLMNCSRLRILECLGSLATLKILDISGCKELETLNVEGLSSIIVIKVNGCWKLRNVKGLILLNKLACFQISFDNFNRSNSSMAGVSKTEKKIDKSWSEKILEFF